MDTFQLFLLAREHFDPAAYNTLFRQEIEALLPKLKAPKQLEGLSTFDFVGYILASLRNAGFRGQEIEDRAHEIVVRLIVVPGTFFRNYKEGIHGLLIARFKVAVKNAIANIVAKERHRRARIHTTTYPLAFLWLPERDQKVVEDFRKFVFQRLGPLGLAVLDARLEGEQMKSLVGAIDLNSPTTYLIKMTVRRIKGLAQEFGRGTGDPDFLGRVEAARRRTGKD
jgi:hypothetical protein